MNAKKEQRINWIKLLGIIHLIIGSVLLVFM